MLHPLNASQIDPSLLFPLTFPVHNLSKSPSKHPTKSSHPSLSRTTTKTVAAPTADSESPTTPDHGSQIDVGNEEQFQQPPPRKRLKTTSEQINMLEEWFLKEPLPPRKVREEMVLRLDNSVSLRQLEVWFQNRRAKQKKADARSGGGRVDSPMLASSPPSSPTSTVPGTPPNAVPTSPPAPTTPRGVATKAPPYPFTPPTAQPVKVPTPMPPTATASTTTPPRPAVVTALKTSPTHRRSPLQPTQLATQYTTATPSVPPVAPPTPSAAKALESPLFAGHSSQ